MFRRLMVLSLLVSSNVFAQGDYSAEMGCLSGILENQYLNRGEHKYTQGQSAALKKNGALAVYPFEDSKVPGLFHFYTRENGYSHLFKFPQYDYARYQTKLQRLRDQLDKIDKDTSETAKEENCDIEKIIGEFTVFSQTLDKSWSQDKTKAAVMAKADELFKAYPRTHALFTQYFDVQAKRDKLAQNPPWGLVGAALGNYLVPLPEGELNVVPFINREFYGLAYDGQPWRDVKLFAPTQGCNQCVRLDFQPEPSDVATARLNEEVSAKLDIFWNNIVKNPYGNLLEDAKKNTGIRSSLTFDRARLSACSQVPGEVGLKATNYVRQIDAVVPHQN